MLRLASSAIRVGDGPNVVFVRLLPMLLVKASDGSSSLRRVGVCRSGEQILIRVVVVDVDVPSERASPKGPIWIALSGAEPGVPVQVASPAFAVCSGLVPAPGRTTELASWRNGTLRRGGDGLGKLGLEAVVLLSSTAGAPTVRLSAEMVKSAAQTDDKAGVGVTCAPNGGFADCFAPLLCFLSCGSSSSSQCSNAVALACGD